MKALVGTFNQERALPMDRFTALVHAIETWYPVSTCVVGISKSYSCLNLFLSPPRQPSVRVSLANFKPRSYFYSSLCLLMVSKRYFKNEFRSPKNQKKAYSSWLGNPSKSVENSTLGGLWTGSFCFCWYYFTETRLISHKVSRSTIVHCKM